MDLKAVFRLVDVDKSGSISRTVSARINVKVTLMIKQLYLKEAKMAAKLLVKRFGIKDVSKNRHKTSIRIVLCHQQTLPVWIYC